MGFRKSCSVQNLSPLLTSIYYSFPTTSPYLMTQLTNCMQFKMQFEVDGNSSVIISSPHKKKSHSLDHSYTYREHLTVSVTRNEHGIIVHILQGFYYNNFQCSLLSPTISRLYRQLQPEVAHPSVLGQGEKQKQEESRPFLSFFSPGLPSPSAVPSENNKNFTCVKSTGDLSIQHQ